MSDLDNAFHHYVPQLLLRHFTIDGSNQTHVFDKRSSKSYLSNINRTAGERKFNDAVTETWLSDRIETPAAPIIKQICDRGDIGFLDPTQKEAVASFVAAQFLRVKSLREQIMDVGRAVREHLQHERVDPKLSEVLSEVSEDMARNVSLSLLRGADDFAPLVHDKLWILFNAIGDSSFHIGDSPIVLDNTLGREYDQDPLGPTLGFNVPGIEIYMPLHPKYTIAFYCPTLGVLMRETFRKYLERKVDGADPDPNFERLGYILDSIDYGYPVPITDAVTWHLNGLQAAYASRIVVSADGQFDQLKNAVESNESLSRAPMLRVYPDNIS